MTRFTRSANGKYVVQGKSYEMLIGTRAQVWHGTAYKTSGGLTKTDLLQNKNGRIVSRAKHSTAKKENRLVKAGFGTKKGVFGYVQLNKKTKSKRSKQSGGVGMPGNNNNNNNNNNSNPMMKMAAVKNMGGKQSGGVGNMPGNNSNSNNNSSNSMMKMAAVKNMSSNKSGGRRSRRGGSGMSALSPSSFNGKGVGTSGVDLQFIAGNAA
jgi:hypothetical protein